MILALTFVNPLDYDKILEDDYFDICGLVNFTPGQPLQLKVYHKDGSMDEIILSHTFNKKQIGWFKSGSALNAIAEGVD